MLIKITGALAVAVAGALLGLYYSGLEGFRIQDLLEFKKALTILASEIDYLSTPLPEAMGGIARRTGKPVNALFQTFAESLSDNDGETAFHLWEAAVEKHAKYAYLAAEDREVIKSFGKTLGYLDKAMQLNSIRFTVDYIDDKVNSLRAQCDRNKRMYRSLGVLGSALLVAVLW